jgi:hypothetical protein
MTAQSENMRAINYGLVITKLISPAILSTWLLHQCDHQSLVGTLRRIHDVSFVEDDNITSTNYLLDPNNVEVLSANREELNASQLIVDISHSNIDVIEPENTQAMIIQSTHQRNISRQNLLFHLIHTSTEENFATMQKQCIESIFYHHPLATVMLHVKNMTNAPVKYLQQAGYDLQVVKYDVVENLKLLEGETKPVVDVAILRNFTSRISDYANDSEGFWYSNESNLLRLIVLYLHGGIYLGMYFLFLDCDDGCTNTHCQLNLDFLSSLLLDTDTVVVKRLDGLATNTIGFQDQKRKELNGAVLMLEKYNEFTRACLKDFLTNFNNRVWGENGPYLITRVYFSKRRHWNIHAVPRSHFEYFGWERIGDLCYNNTNNEMVMHHVRLIREKAYVVHLNNKMGHAITEGSVCECLRNTFCLSRGCTPLDHCVNLIRENNPNPSADPPQFLSLTLPPGNHDQE